MFPRFVKYSARQIETNKKERIHAYLRSFLVFGVISLIYNYMSSTFHGVKAQDLNFHFFSVFFAWRRFNSACTSAVTYEKPTVTYAVSCIHCLHALINMRIVIWQTLGFYRVICTRYRAQHIGNYVPTNKNHSCYKIVVIADGHASNVPHHS